MKSLVVLFGLGLLGWAYANPLPDIIPMPVEIESADGRLQLSERIDVEVEGDLNITNVVRRLRALGFSPQRAAADTKGVLRVVRGEVKNPHGFEGAYQLDITSSGILITANDDLGALYAVVTMGQILQSQAGAFSVPCLTIRDWPAFSIRGFMLDTGRNYQSPELIKEQIEVMARYKLNVFHFHLTDNPGWRLESVKHPKVTSFMSRQAGEFYTRREFRDLVEFCLARGITLIPELDIPGHTAAFRKSMGIESMNTPESRAIVKDLFTELASLATADEMPYIHLGTDEIRHPGEKVDATYLPEMSAHIRSMNREVIGWRQGLEDPADKKRITQLWARADPHPENPFIDSRSTYINHMDPFEIVSTFLFQQSCRAPHGDAYRLGGIMCSWPDIRIEKERDQLRQNPVYPGMLAFAESLWRGVPNDDKERYWANLPEPGTPEFAKVVEFEKRLLNHKDRYFQNKEFPYHKQTDMRWRLLGPLPHGGDVTRAFPVEEKLEDSYEIDGKTYQWLDRKVGAATLYFRHFFGFGGLVDGNEGTCYALTHIWSPKDQKLPVWLGFHHSSRSDRRGATHFKRGEWHSSQPWARVNGRFIDPPAWEITTPKNDETPFTDEDYFFRDAVSIDFKKGWNEVLLKVPKRSGDWKWVSTFIPIGDTRELKYSDDLSPE